ncbi:MAG: efflux RND transporter periplasmic adaptor subunit, partial [Deltaproteobacteria bacterium]|nr:efflux RND transporter periplasmic adaptor subunit [Deltaproteobacteria bacterium]
MNPVKRRNRLFPYCWAKGVSASLAALFILSFTACGKKEPEVAKEVIRPVKTLTVKSGAGVEGLTLPGKVRASKRVNLAFKEVGGRLSHLPIAGKEGQDVKKGALLARIDPKDFQTNLANAQGRLKTAKAGLELAKKEYARVKRIRDKDPGAVSGADIDRKMEAVNQSEGRIKSLKATVDDARNQLSYTYLRAPFSGVIAKRFVDNFQEVKPKQPIVSLQDITHVEILVDVPENVIAVTAG